MPSSYESVWNMLSVYFSNEQPTPNRIREMISSLGAILQLTDEEAEKMARDFEMVHGVVMTLGSALEGEGFEKWLDGRRHELDFFYWSRYRKLLSQRSFSGQVVASLDSITDRILGLLENPIKEGVWDRRGMVVGHVQSGKTANYSGVVCKAADAGYKVIIVIAGIHNSLRSQTQRRLDEAFLGYDSSRLTRSSDKRAKDFYIGAGKLDPTRRPISFTNSMRDFNKATATGVGIPLDDLSEPSLFVIKKNTSTLKNMIEWLKEHNAKRGTNKISAPVLIIDDEADNASINIGGGEADVSRINGQIRDLLNLFERSCYVGYTATPFANIFIDPENDHEMLGADLFPRDFIVSLDPPDNYFGAKKIFLEGDEGDAAFIRYIHDNEDVFPIKHKRNFSVTGLPQSLKDAIRVFLLSKAIRRIRGHKSFHASMLVNCSRFIDVQRQLRNEIHSFLDEIKASLNVYSGLDESDSLKDPEMQALHRVWESEFSVLGATWPDIQFFLLEEACRVQVLEINSNSSASLDYEGSEEHGLHVIAVGGFSLSRGLTLEGLVTSYFLRNSMMYDTLMQMGRWFGYRPGYEDLCRIWMPEEAVSWYTHIADAVEELRDELTQMEAVNATPREFGLKVRTHPGSLIITARNKMGRSESIPVSIGLGNEFIETSVLVDTSEANQRNLDAAVRLCEAAKATVPELCSASLKAGYLFKNISVSDVEDFLAAFESPRDNVLADSGPILNYIGERRCDELSLWDLYVPGKSNPDRTDLAAEVAGLSLICQRRSKGKRSGAGLIYVGGNQRVASRGVEKVGIPDRQAEAAEAEYRKQHLGVEGGEKPQSVNYPDYIYRRVRSKPLLILHFLAMGGKGDELGEADMRVAWSISFPTTKKPERLVEYRVNSAWFSERFGGDEDEGDD